MVSEMWQQGGTFQVITETFQGMTFIDNMNFETSCTWKMAEHGWQIISVLLLAPDYKYHDLSEASQGSELL